MGCTHQFNIPSRMSVESTLTIVSALQNVRLVEQHTKQSIDILRPTHHSEYFDKITEETQRLSKRVGQFSQILHESEKMLTLSKGSASEISKFDVQLVNISFHTSLMFKATGS